MTGSASDPADWQGHIRNKPRRETLANRFRDPNDPFQLVIVRDMWLTGFDAPSLHTMYVDKPMRGHGLMQAIARVNRVFRDKPGELEQTLRRYQNRAIEAAQVIEELIALAKYLFVDQAVPAMWRSLAAARLRADCPSGNAPTTRVRRLISRNKRSSGLLVRMRRQCSSGKA